MKQTITLDKTEYIQLLICEMELRRLQNGGVDNWQGYYDSLNTEYDTDYDTECAHIKLEVEEL